MTKSKLFILSMCLFAALCLQAQEKMPQAISCQAVARDAQGKVIAAQTIGVKVEILKGSASGEVVFSETHNPTSSRTGTANLLIGQGSPVTGEFAAIDWGGDTYYLQLSMDVAGGSNYQLVSTTQMLPVPYALYAAKAGSAKTVENGGNSGGETVRFLLTETDRFYIRRGILYQMVAGKVERDHIYYDGNILYLDGINHELLPSIETEEGEVISYFSDGHDGTTPGVSTILGRKFLLETPEESLLPDKTYFLIVRDAKNNIVQKFPFKACFGDNYYDKIEN